MSEPHYFKLDWKPINTAPLDGRHVLVFQPGCRHEKARTAVAAWTTYTKSWQECPHGVEGLLDPSHWHPLPLPPGAAEPVDPATGFDEQLQREREDYLKRQAERSGWSKGDNE